MYKLYIDKSADFSCDIQVKNASTKNSIARMIIKSEDVTLLFEGKIENGKCTIPINHLRGLMDENTTGKMSLEIIVEGTYFSPWSDDFSAEEHTSVKVKVNENHQSSKPSVAVKVPQTSPSVKRGNMVPIIELRNLCKKFGYTRQNVGQYRQSFHQLINEYFQANPELFSQKKSVLGMVRYLLK